MTKGFLPLGHKSSSNALRKSVILLALDDSHWPKANEQAIPGLHFYLL